MGGELQWLLIAMAASSKALQEKKGEHNAHAEELIFPNTDLRCSKARR